MAKLIVPIAEKQQKKIAIEFSKWLILKNMWQSDLTFDELYDVWCEWVEEETL